MLPLSKPICANLGTAATAGATVTANVDCLGHSYAIMDLMIEGTSATTAVTALVLKQSDDNTTFTNITGFVGGTSFTIPTTIRTLGNASGPSIVRFGVDLRGRGRYLQVSVTCGGTNHIRHLTQLFRADEPEQTTATALVSTTADLLVTG